MKFEEAMPKILAEFNKRAPNAKCPLCQSAFSIVPAFAVLQVQDEYRVLVHNRPPKDMPLAAFVCGNCGNTQFINLLTLGLGDLFKIDLFGKEK